MNTEHTNQPRQAEPATHSPIALQYIPKRQRDFTAENIRDIAHECMRIGDNEQAEVVFAIADALRDGNLIIQSPAQQQAEPVAWVRFCSDGCYEGPIMNSDSRMDGVRRTSGAWTPLYAAQPPAVAVPAEWLKNSGWARVPLREQARTVAVPSRMSYKNATQEFADGYNACIDDMLAATPQGASCLPAEMTPAMMRAVQMRSELGAYAAANLSGAYDLFADFWRVAVEEVKKGGA